ncbi:MAG: hypothetical protein AB7Q97_00725 [Gammaproteobacteria bacterium]
MIRKLHHALTRADYILEEDGSVRVLEGDQWGRFDGAGYWLEGPLRSCDPQMCRWLVSELEMNRFATTPPAAG